MKFKLLYLCYSNKGRSIALEGYTNYFLKKEKLENILCDSAGVGYDMIMSLRERDIDSASRNTTYILKNQGIDIKNHKIKYVGEIIEKTDLILVSDLISLALFRTNFSEYKQQAMLAKEYAGFTRNLEIFGPYAESRKLKNPQWTEMMGYEHMLREIKIVSKRIVKKLKKL